MSQDSAMNNHVLLKIKRNKKKKKNGSKGQTAAQNEPQEIFLLIETYHKGSLLLNHNISGGGLVRMKRLIG